MIEEIGFISVDNHDSFMSCQIKNYPVIVKDIATSWLLSTSLNSSTNPIKWLEKEFDNQEIPVDLYNDKNDSYSSCERKMMKISEYYQLSQQVNTPPLYAKDWHSFLGKSKRYLYSTPDLFTDDWLNWYYEVSRKNDDYKFMYIGNKNTVTYLHHDICCSYSWSVNLMGRKKWYLWPPSKASLLFKNNNLHGELSLNDPRFDKLNTYSSSIVSDDILDSCIILMQEKSDGIFVPSGWFHFVENIIEDKEGHGFDSSNDNHLNYTISINHNWFNGFSVHEIYAFLLRDLAKIKNEISHLRPNSLHNVKKNNTFDSGVKLFTECEYYNQCERLLKANTSIGLLQFIEILTAKAYTLLKYSSCSKSNAGQDDKFDNYYENESSNISLWKNYFCPLYCLDDFIELDSPYYLRMQSSIVNTSPVRFKANYLSNYFAEPALEFFDIQFDDYFMNIPFPVDLMTFSLLVIQNIVITILRYDELIRHLYINIHTRNSNATEPEEIGFDEINDFYFHLNLFSKSLDDYKAKV